jgi:transposase
MTRITEFIQLTKEERSSLKTLFRSGKGANRQQTRARILDLLDRKVPPPKIAEALSCAVGTVYNVKRRYQSEGLDAALTDKPRSGNPPSIDGTHRAKITALACSPAPEGRSRWSLRLLADRAVQLGFVESISHNAVKQILKKNKLKPHLKKQWCIGAITAEYLARMEDLLHLYSLAYDEKRPVICFDELPAQLLGDVVEPLPMKAGKAERFDYEYERGG